MKRHVLLLPVLLAMAACDTPGSVGGASVASGAKGATLAFQADPTFGERLSRGQWRQLAAAEREALDFASAGRSVEWASRTGRASGTVIVSAPFRVTDRECRRFEHRLTAGGDGSVRGVACREGEAGWTLVS